MPQLDMYQRFETARSLIDYFSDVYPSLERIAAVIQENQKTFGAIPGQDVYAVAARYLENIARNATEKPEFP